MAWLKNNKKIILFSGALLGLIVVDCLIMNYFPVRDSSPLTTGTIAINNHPISVEIALTPAQQYSGLSNRAALGADCGMLFNFPSSEEQKFVMRNMKFPLDIIFFNDGVIIKIAANLAPEGSNPQQIYGSAGAANQVLEVNGGYCAANNIRVGDKIQLSI
jgi:uncharacterized membrane protein (UPF0127 family)